MFHLTTCPELTKLTARNVRKSIILGNQDDLAFQDQHVKLFFYFYPDQSRFLFSLVSILVFRSKLWRSQTTMHCVIFILLLPFPENTAGIFCFCFSKTDNLTGNGNFPDLLFSILCLAVMLSCRFKKEWCGHVIDSRKPYEMGLLW